MRRTRLDGAFSRATGAHRLTLVTAPAGYGKSTALSEWVRDASVPCAWLSLDRFDAQPGRLLRGVAAAIRDAAVRPDALGTLLTALDGVPARDRPASHDLVFEALDHLAGPLVLVIDNIHLVGSGPSDGILGLLAASAPPNLRMVFSGRGGPHMGLERHRYEEGLSELHAADLAFTCEEVAGLVGMLGRDAALDSESLWRISAGWPVGVRAALTLPAAARKTPSPHAFAEDVPLHDYVVEEVLAPLDAALADFVLRSTTCDRLDRGLAVGLHGGPDGYALLRECVREGLFLEEAAGHDGEAVYRWNSLFAAQCRGVLERRDPLLAERLHRVAARYYQDVDACESVAEAIKGHAPRQALMTLGTHWLEFVLRNGTHAFGRLCRALPASWDGEPDAHRIRAVCRGLTHGPRTMADSSGQDAPERGYCASCDRTAEAPGSPPVDRILSLWQTGHFARPLPAAGKQEANPDQGTPGLDGGRFTAELALAFAAGGDLSAARQLGRAQMEQKVELEVVPPERRTPFWLAHGIAHYWHDDLDDARAHLGKALDASGHAPPFGPLAGLYRTLVDCATGCAAPFPGPVAAVDAVGGGNRMGPSWDAFHTIAAAKTAEARGDLAGALAIVRPLGIGGHPPLVDALLAELLRRGGKLAAALRCAESSGEARRNSYVDTSMALTEALVANAWGDTAMVHDRLEHAVQRAEPQGILRPFSEREPELAGLLLQHNLWDTAHGAFIAAWMAQQAPQSSLEADNYRDLTEREKEILVCMRSLMTAADIAATLFISVNTVKTHQRAIYRKLGAANRREALRIALERRVI